MEEFLEKDNQSSFEVEVLLTNIQELHFSKLLQFFNCKNMNDLELKFKKYCIYNFIRENEIEIKRVKDNVLFDEQDYLEYLRLLFKEYLKNFEKQYNKTFRRGKEWKK